MSNIIPFNSSSQLPAHLARRRVAANNDLTTNVGMGGFPIMSIKGKVFTLVKADERTLIEKADEEGEMQPARHIDIVLLKANPNLSKVWYAAGYTDGSAEKPDCFSNDGQVPDPSSPALQSKSCKVCPHNAFGSATNGKGKACSDSRRMAIAGPNTLNDPMLLRVPPASLRPLADYARMLDKRGVDYDAVITRLKFDPTEATPKLVFEAKAFLTEELYEQVQEQKEEELVSFIIGTAEMPGHAQPAAEEVPQIEGTPPKAAQRSKPAPAPVPEDDDEPVVPVKKPKPAPVEDDEPVVTPPKKTKPAPAPVPEDDDEPVVAPVKKAKPAPVPEDDKPVEPVKKAKAPEEAAPKKTPKVAVAESEDDVNDLLASLGLDD